MILRSARKYHATSWFVCLIKTICLLVMYAHDAGLAMLEAGPPLELDTSSILSHASNGAVYVSESLLIFLFAGVALDFCIKLGILSPFPIEESVPRT